MGTCAAPVALRLSAYLLQVPACCTGWFRVDPAHSCMLSGADKFPIA